MLPFGERRANRRSKANSFRARRQWIFITAGGIAVVFLFVSLQFYSLWADYKTAFGLESQTQTWIDRNLVDHSIDAVDTLNTIHRLEVAALRYSLKQIPVDSLATTRHQLSAMLLNFAEGGLLWQEMRMIGSYDDAFADANAFVEKVRQFELGNATIEAVTKSGETAIGRWSMFKMEALEQEVALRGGMERAVKNFRPIADSSVLMFFVLALLAGILYVVGVYAVYKLLDIQHRRFLRFEFLVAAISHDLRSPLQAIGHANFLLSSAASMARRDKCIGIIATSVKTLTRLVDDIDLAQQGNAHALQLSYVDLRGWLSEFMPAYLDKAASKGLELTHRIEIENVLVEIDPERMTRSLGNLIDNAIKYTSSGSVSVSVRLREQEDRDGRRHLVFKVRDTGPGIRTADQTRIFMPFERGQPTGWEQANSSGMGLGLSIVQRMAKSYRGGFVTVQSELGNGSVFKIDIPVRTRVDLDSLPPHPVIDSQYFTDENTKEILVVDVDPEVCASLVEILQDAGFSADTASDGAEALRMLSDHAYKVVITAIEMSNMEGFQLASSIRSILQPIPYLIAITASTSALSEDPRAAVFDGVVSKPLDEIKLVTLVEQGVERGRDSMVHAD